LITSVSSANDIGLMVAYAYAAQFPEATERVVLMDAFLPGIGDWVPECETAMTGNPLILRETRWTTISFTLSVATSLWLVLRPVLGWYGSKMGARRWLPFDTE
jgi:pimeloyl-ACP methyl ester carboxylesterase